MCPVDERQYYATDDGKAITVSTYSTYPLEKYRYYTTEDNRVIAVSTYAGKTVRGVAKCAPGDEFDLEKGKKLAAARCAKKIANRRLRRAIQKFNESRAMAACAWEHQEKMHQYFCDAKVESMNADARIAQVMDEM